MIKKVSYSKTNWDKAKYCNRKCKDSDLVGKKNEKTSLSLKKLWKDGKFNNRNKDLYKKSSLSQIGILFIFSLFDLAISSSLLKLRFIHVIV